MGIDFDIDGIGARIDKKIESVREAFERYVEEKMERRFDSHMNISHSPDPPEGTPPDDGVYVKPGDVVIINRQERSPAGGAEFALAEKNCIDSEWIYITLCQKDGILNEHASVRKDILTTRDGKKVLGVRG